MFRAQLFFAWEVCPRCAGVFAGPAAVFRVPCAELRRTLASVRAVGATTVPDDSACGGEGDTTSVVGFSVVAGGAGVGRGRVTATLPLRLCRREVILGGGAGAMATLGADRFVAENHTVPGARSFLCSGVTLAGVVLAFLSPTPRTPAAAMCRPSDPTVARVHAKGIGYLKITFNIIPAGEL